VNIILFLKIGSLIIVSGIWASRFVAGFACFLASGYSLHHLHGFASLAVSVVPLLSLSQGAPRARSHHGATWCALVRPRGFAALVRLFYTPLKTKDWRTNAIYLVKKS
jgi:NO-binding membrane sensor protein with MHYT domain